MSHLFDPHAYLAANADLDGGLGAQGGGGAWAHYRDLGHAQRRPGVGEGVRRVVSAVRGVAPGGAPDGRDLALDVFHAAGPHLSLESPLRVLEVAGDGPRAYPWVPLAAPQAVIDVAVPSPGGACGPRHANLMERQRGVLRTVRFQRGQPLPFHSGLYDLAYAGDGFALLAAAEALRLLFELRRVCRAEAIVLVACGPHDPLCARAFTVLGRIPGPRGCPDRVVGQRPREPVI
jgi:hypothetical protein